MRYIINPKAEEWQELCQRPAIDITTLFDAVRPIIDDVRYNGDKALYGYEQRFDGVNLSSLTVSEEEMEEALQKVNAMPNGEALKKAIDTAVGNIRRFHEAQRFATIEVETMPGVKCWQKSVAIENVGLYVPGGSAPLFSTVLMLAIPASIAGCKNICICTPPQKDGSVNPVVLYASRACDIYNIYKVGGAQAVAAMAVGTESIPKVDKIFGPGNRYVMAAKQWVALQGVGIDMPAGPSEVEVIADETCIPEYVAADLLSQAEHGPDSQVMLLATSRSVADSVMQELQKQLALLPRQDVAEKSLEGSRVIVFDERNATDNIIRFTNLYAPEHLIIATKNCHELAEQVTTAGSVFLGNYACESAGDYASGTNHTLPTMGYARAYSGLSLDSFCRKMTIQELTAEGIRSIGKDVVIMAEAEGLEGHANAMRVRGVSENNVQRTWNVRPNIERLKPYSCARDEFKGGNSDTVFLDANENPYSIEAPLNRYPDPLQWELKAEIARRKGVKTENIFLGNGSDEAIDLIFRVFCTPGRDNVVAIEPTYGMYSVCADINDVEYRRMELHDDFVLDTNDIIREMDCNTKAIFVCSPNNPTGTLYTKEIKKLLDCVKDCIIIVDEAYIDFCPEESVRSLIYEHDNLIVLSTFSKAWASAGVRLGMAFAAERIINIINKVKYPYNVNLLTQRYALQLLREHYDDIETWVESINRERFRVTEAFRSLPVCEKIYDSHANFFLARVTDANGIYQYLANNNVIVRNRNSVTLCGNCLRITVGTPTENDTLINLLDNYKA